MTRVLTFVLAIAIVAGVLLLPEASRSKLGILAAYETLLTADGPEVEGAETPKLHDVFFNTPAWKDQEEGLPRFLLGGVLFADSSEDSDGSMISHGELRTALVRALRQVSGQRKDADDNPAPFELVGADNPAVYGLNVRVELTDDELIFGWNMREEPMQFHRQPFRPADPFTLLPPLVAIALAVMLRRPVLSLFVGVLAGSILLQQGSGDGVVVQAAKGFGEVFTTFFWNEAGNSDRMRVVGFVVAMLAMVGVITKNGGIRGVMNIVAKWARTARSTQMAAFFMGLAVFFDDYANTILVGSTMRPLTDKFRIAREKLAYIVDSTAAPVAGLSIFSTWIAFEVSTFSSQLPMAGMSPEDGYGVFIATLPYRFYCLLSLAFVFLVTFTGRDFGPMLTAERRARKTGRVVREGGTPMVSDVATAMAPAEGITIQAWRAILPLAVFVGVTCGMILYTGGAFKADAPSLFSFSGLSAILGGGNSYLALWYGSSLGLAVAVVASLAAGLRFEILDAAYKTLTSMGVALGILYLAWMIGAVCGELNTAHYLTVLLDNLLFPLALPVILFVLSGAIAFSTGSSWSTMSILLPLVVGLSFSLGERTEGIDGYMLMVLSIGAVLEGSIFGDHCSPISDTTVLSSVASASDHIDHVRTQGPYAFFVMLVAIVVGYLPAAAFGLHPGLSLLAGVAILWLGLRILGERVDEGDSQGPDPAHAPE